MSRNIPSAHCSDVQVGAVSEAVKICPPPAGLGSIAIHELDALLASIPRFDVPVPRLLPSPRFRPSWLPEDAEPECGCGCDHYQGQCEFWPLERRAVTVTPWAERSPRDRVRWHMRNHPELLAAAEAEWAAADRRVA